MLRITIVDSPNEQRLVLYGKLVGPWIGELKRVWENLRQQLGNRRSVVDLNEVTPIDDSADQLLAAMLEQGAELIARGTANPWLIQAIKAGKNRPCVTALRPRAPREPSPSTKYVPTCIARRWTAPCLTRS